MTRRRRGRASPDRGRGAPDRGAVAGGAAVRGNKKRDRQVAQHDVRQRRIKKWRTAALFIGLVPLVGSATCDWGLLIACIPREVYLGIWAAIVGAVVGLSIRLVLERRRFEQESPPG